MVIDFISTYKYSYGHSQNDLMTPKKSGMKVYEKKILVPRNKTYIDLT